jgi:glycosyltransferase involved in cell wall biosynthesis
VLEADVFVFPSVLKAESLPTVVIEALYCGKPIIATDIGEVKEMMVISGRDEIPGIVLDADDKVHLIDALVGAMKRYVDDRALLQQHSSLAKEAFRKFDMETCARKYLKVFEEVIQ